MTLDEAIEHALDVSDKLGCCQCSENHRLLAAWLYELKMWRSHPFKMLFVWIGCKYRMKNITMQ